MAAIEKRPGATSKAQQVIKPELRALIVKLRRQAWSMEDIAHHPDVNLSGHSAVRYHLDAHLAEVRASSAEDTEALRIHAGASLDSLERGLWDELESADALMERLAVRDRILRVHERRAKLFGLDLQVGVVAVGFTREMFAETVWADEPAAIEGEAVEITGEAGEDA